MDLIPKSFFSNDLFDDFMEKAPRKHIGMNCDIYEKDGKYHIEMDLPGVNKEDVNLDIDDGYLTIDVSQHEENTEEKKNYIRKERFSGSLVRRFYVGDVNENDIKAEFKDGVLRLEINKALEQEKKKKVIPIN